MVVASGNVSPRSRELLRNLIAHGWINAVKSRELQQVTLTRRGAGEAELVLNQLTPQTRTRRLLGISCYLRTAVEVAIVTDSTHLTGKRAVDKTHKLERWWREEGRKEGGEGG